LNLRKNERIPRHILEIKMWQVYEI